MKLLITFLFASSITLLTASAQCNGCPGGKKKGDGCKKDEPALTFNDCDKGKKKGDGCKKDDPALAFTDCDKDKKKCGKDEKPA